MATTFNGGPNRKKFDVTHCMALGTYVYALFDPRDKFMIYVGKGNGNRLFGHFEEADLCWEPMLRVPRAGRPQPSAKIQAIHAVWQADFDVEWKILAYDIQNVVDGNAPTPDRIAHEIEAVVIDAINGSRNDVTKNDVAGIRTLSKGPLDAPAVWRLGWLPVNPVDPHPFVFAFQIQNARNEGRDVYDATRRAWAVSKANREQMPSLAVGIENGFSVGVFEITDWAPTDDSKWQFIGQPLSKHELDQKDWRRAMAPVLGYLQHGGGYFIADFDSHGHIRFLRGIEKKQRGVVSFPLSAVRGGRG